MLLIVECSGDILVLLTKDGTTNAKRSAISAIVAYGQDDMKMNDTFDQLIFVLRSRREGLTCGDERNGEYFVDFAAFDDSTRR